MYFGPEIVTDEKREFWHDELWQDLLLFKEYEIKNNNEGQSYVLYILYLN